MHGTRDAHAHRMLSLSSANSALAAFLVASMASRVATAAPTTTEPEGRGPEARHGFYVAPELKTTAITNELALLVGGQAGWLIDHRFVVGLAGYGLASTHSAPRAVEQPGTPSVITMAYGGLRLAYVLMPYARVHGVFGAVIGGGRASANSNDVSSAFAAHHVDAFFTVEPLAELELNVDTNVRVALGGSWRYIAPTGVPGLSSSDLGGPAGSLILRYGFF